MLIKFFTTFFEDPKCFTITATIVTVYIELDRVSVTLPPAPVKCDIVLAILEPHDSDWSNSV